MKYKVVKSNNVPGQCSPSLAAPATWRHYSGSAAGTGPCTCDLERGEAGGLAQRVPRHAHVEALVPAPHILQQQHRVLQL